MKRISFVLDSVKWTIQTIGASELGFLYYVTNPQVLNAQKCCSLLIFW